MLSRNFLTERKRQIDTLKIFNDNVAEIKENTEYQIEFMGGKNKMYLDVILCPEFPYEKPILMVRPQIRHPWVAENSSSIIGAPGLLNFTVHSDLGRVVQAIIREFEQKPPMLLEEMSNMSETDMGNPLCGMVPSPSFQVNSPIRPVSFPELQCLSIEELTYLNESDDLQDKFIESLQPTIDHDKCIIELMDSIEQLAKYNQNKESMLDDIKKELLDKIEKIYKLKHNYEVLSTKRAKLCSEYSPHALLAKLGAATLKADEECDHVAESFLQGEIDCDAFLKEYLVKRKLGHSRRACQERLSHQLLQFDNAA